MAFGRQHKICFAPGAAAELRQLDPPMRDAVLARIRRGLERFPTRPSVMWIRKLHDLAGPAFRLRMGPVRVFYDVRGSRVWVLSVARMPRLDLGCDLRRRNRQRVPDSVQVLPSIGGRPVRARRLSDVKDDLSNCLREARDEPIVITSHGRVVGLLVGFAGEDDWLEYRLRNDRAFLERIERARRALLAGRAAFP